MCGGEVIRYFFFTYNLSCKFHPIFFRILKFLNRFRLSRISHFSQEDPIQELIFDKQQVKKTTRAAAQLSISPICRPPAYQRRYYFLSPGNLLHTARPLRDFVSHFLLRSKIFHRRMCGHKKKHQARYLITNWNVMLKIYNAQYTLWITITPSLSLCDMIFAIKVLSLLFAVLFSFLFSSFWFCFLFSRHCSPFAVK